MRILITSDHSAEVFFGDTIAAEHHQKVAVLTRRLLDHASDASTGILNIHPAYSSVLVSFDPRRVTHTAIRELILRCGEEVQDVPASGVDRLIEIPVCYGDEFGPDLDYVALSNGLTCEEVVGIHSSAEYRVFFLGFSPGFPYLGGLPHALATPRLAVPRRLVPAGSVAIGGSQAGIYPLASAAGWRIIGRTALRLFRADRTPPTLLWMGDRVRFVPVSRREYERAQPASR